MPAPQAQSRESLSGDPDSGAGRSRSARGWGARPSVAAGLLTLLAQLPLHAGWLLSPASRTLANPFHGGHAWASDVVGAALWSGAWPSPTRQAGFPGEWDAHFVAWAVHLVAALFRPILSAVAVVNLAGWLGPALGAAVVVRLIARMDPTVRRAGLVAGGILFGLAPVTLGAVASGQIENGQAWVLPLLLLSLSWRARWAAPVWAVGVWTSPYLAALAVFASPWVVARLGWRSSGPSLLAAAGGVLVAQLGVTPGEFDPTSDLFRPAWTPDAWAPLWIHPAPSADLQTLLTGVARPQARTMVLHQPYLGLVFAGVALVFGRGRRAWAWPIIMGLLLALGPELGSQNQPVLWRGEPIPLPAVIVRWLDLPLAHGGQYYRCILLAHLGFAGLIATVRAPAVLAAGVGVGVLDALRVVAMLGVPWPTVALPLDDWQIWASDPVPGAVLHLPLRDPTLAPCHPVRLAGHVVHQRALADLPRNHPAVADHPMMRTLAQCGVSASSCDWPDTQALAHAGFRYLVLDLPPGPAHHQWARRLRAEYGSPSVDGGESGLSWWTLPAVDAVGDGDQRTHTE